MDELTLFLAKIMGLYALLEGASMIVRRKLLLAVFAEIAEHKAISYVMGILMVIMGLLLVVGHTNFENAPATVVSIVGWWVLLEGASFIFMSDSLRLRMFRSVQNSLVYLGIGLGYIALGAYLTLAGFF